jgi:hypothetical protein
VLGVGLAVLTVFVGVLVLLAVAFYGLSHVFVHASGWSQLASLYTAKYQPQGTLFEHVHVRVGAVRYRNGATVVVSPLGLYLAASALVVSQHPPLLIPWNAFSAVQPTRIYWLSAMAMIVGTPPVATIAVLERVYRAAQPYVNPLLNMGEGTASPD